MEIVHATPEDFLNHDHDLHNILTMNIREEEDELDFDLDYDPNQMYYELLAS
jgi:hypothetical protein